MTKIVLQDVASFTNEPSAISITNANSAVIEAASDNFLSRDGTAPNQMGADLDMNSNQILNIGDPLDMNGSRIIGLNDAVAGNEPVTLSQFEAGVGSSGAIPITASVVTIAAETALPNERQLVVGTGMSLTDGGPSSTITVNLDGDLQSISTLATTGIGVRTAADTWATRSITQPAAGITVANNDGVAGNPTIALANDLSAVEGLAGTGYAVRTAADSWTNRSLVMPAAGIAGINLDGVAGNTTLSLVNDLSAVEGLAGTGLAARTAADTWTTRTITGPAAGISVANGAGVAGNPTLSLTNDLSAVEGLATTGLTARTAADTWATRTITGAAAGVSVSNGDGVAGNPTLSLANDLSAVEGLATTGMAARTAADTWTTRTITGTANEITVTNGDGVSGAPTLSIPTSVTFTGKTITGGTYSSPTISGGSLTGTTDIQQNLQLTGDISPTSLSADQNDYNPTGLSTASTLRLTASVSVNITGLAGGADGRILFIHNIGSGAITLKDESASSTAANRFSLTADIAMSQDMMVVLQYDSTSSRWRAVSGGGGGGGGASAATQAEQEAGASTAVYTSPARQQYHPSAAKAWVTFNSAGTVAASYNVSSITDGGSGSMTVNFTTSFSSANYGIAGVVGDISGGDNGMGLLLTAAPAAGSCQFGHRRQADGGFADPNSPDVWSATFFGDFA